MTTLTYKQVRRALDDVLRREGKKTVYAKRYKAVTGEKYNDWEECLYQQDGKPLCIVGVVFDDLGVAYDPAWERQDILTILPMLKEDGVELTPKASTFLTVVQSAQDEGATWGTAVKRGKRYIRNSAELVV